MSLKVITKLVVLLSALSATIIAIFWLNQGHMNSFWTSLGMGSSVKRLNWCEERVEKLLLYGSGAYILEKDGEWLLENGNESTVSAKKLDYLRVEKWFAKYCQIPIDQDQITKMEQGKPQVEVKFINGERLTIHGDGKGYFRIRDQVFSSETLRQGLKELMAFDLNIGYQ